MKKSKVLLSWNAGHSSAVSLFEVKSPEFNLKGLFSSVDEASCRIFGAMTRKELIEAQAASLELPLFLAPSKNSSIEAQVEGSQKVLNESKKQLKGLQGFAFSCFSSAKQRADHELLMKDQNLEAYFLMWGWQAKEVLRVFFSLGYRAVVVAVKLDRIPASFVGREFDQDFLNSLPSNVDRSGESEDFFTFVYDGPFFQRPIALKKGEAFESNGYAVQDFTLGVEADSR